MLTFSSKNSKMKSSCRHMRNLRKNFGTEEDDFSLLKSLLPRFLGCFLARKMGRACIYHRANGATFCIENSLLSEKLFALIAPTSLFEDKLRQGLGA